MNLRRGRNSLVLRAGIILLLAVFILPLSACIGLVTPISSGQPGWSDQTGFTQSPSNDINPSEPSGVNPSESSASTSTTEQTTRPGSFDQDYLMPIDAYGALASGETVRLPGGQWYDLSDSGLLAGVSDLLVESSGTGLATWSRFGETQSVLILDGCSSVTFRNIRFGHDENTRGLGNEANDLPLVSLINCQNITFENCTFFGGSAAGIVLDGSGPVDLIHCQFYNLDGPPVKTGASYKSSQIQAETCTFETRDSGPMMLNVRESHFERCDWIGANGYSIPVFNASQDPRILAGKVWGEDSLPYRLDHVLAAKVDYHRDANQAITLIDNFFCSSEVTDLYDQTDRTLSGLLGRSLVDWSLTGEKEEEAEPGALLDPTLGLRIRLRTMTAQIAVVVTPAPTEPPPPTEATASGDATSPDDAATPDGMASPDDAAMPTETTEPGGTDTSTDSEVPGESSTMETTAPIETTAPTEQMWRPAYTLINLMRDLSPLTGLRTRLDSLMTGSIRLDLVNQTLMPLLTSSLAIAALDDALGDPLGESWLDNATTTLLHDQIIPAEFFGDPIYGNQTANDTSRYLSSSLPIQGLPCALHPTSDQTCFIDHILVYNGTNRAEGTAMHRFEVMIERSQSGTDGVGRSEYPFAHLDVRADSGVMTDQLDGTAVGRLCSLPTAFAKNLILDALRQAGTVSVYRAPDDSGARSGMLPMQALTDLVTNGREYVPMLMFSATESRIEAKVALYDDLFHPHPVLLILAKPGDTWQIQSAKVILEPDPVE